MALIERERVKRSDIIRIIKEILNTSKDSLRMWGIISLLWPCVLITCSVIFKEESIPLLWLLFIWGAILSLLAPIMVARIHLRLFLERRRKK